MGSLPVYLLFFHYIDNLLIQAGTKKVVHRILIAGWAKIKHQPIKLQLAFSQHIALALLDRMCQ
jgi:hypothetical protein